MTNFLTAVKSGFPYLAKEIRMEISNRTPFFIARPMFLYVGIGKKCNAHCITCEIGRANSAGIPHTELHKGDQQLSLGDMRKLFNDIKLFGGGKGTLVSLTGGEPLMHDWLTDALTLAVQMGIDISFTTNGYLLTQPKVESIIQANPFNVGVSLESIDPRINESIRPWPEGTIRTIRGIERLIAERERQGNNRTTINVKTTITAFNYHTLTETAERFGQTKGVMWTPQPYTGKPEDDLWVKDRVGFSGIISALIQLKAKGYAINADDDALRNFIDYFDNTPSPNGKQITVGRDSKPCTVGHRALFIEQDGAVHLCPHFPKVGDLGPGGNLKDLWFSPQAATQREKILKCTRDCQSACTRNTSLGTKMRLFLKRL